MAHPLLESEETRLVVDAISAVLVLLHPRGEKRRRGTGTHEQSNKTARFSSELGTGPSRLHMQEPTAEGCDSEGAGHWFNSMKPELGNCGLFGRKCLKTWAFHVRILALVQTVNIHLFNE